MGFLGASHLILRGRVSGSSGWRAPAPVTGEVVQARRPPKVSAGGTLFQKLAPPPRMFQCYCRRDPQIHKCQRWWEAPFQGYGVTYCHLRQLISAACAFPLSLSLFPSPTLTSCSCPFCFHSLPFSFSSGKAQWLLLPLILPLSTPSLFFLLLLLSPHLFSPSV